MRGNHDAWLAKIPVPDPGAQETTSTDHKIFLTHGHRYDIVEGILADDIKAALVGMW